MMRSMNSAVSALRNHQLKMDVIGNNIANVNTVGFKTGRVTFKDSLSQSLRGASGPSEARGGSNPQQVGLGMDVSSMDTLFTQGVPDRTDRPLDAMINGDGFFMVSGDGTTDGVFYTRAGNFDIDYDGNLVNSDGLRVLGYQADENGNITTAVGGIKVPLASTFDPKVTENVSMQGNLDSRTKVFSGAALLDTTGTDPDTLFKMTVIDPADPTKVKYTVNSLHKDSIARETDIQVIDSLGGRHNIKLAFVKDDDIAPTAPATSVFKIVAFSMNEDGSMTPANATGFADANDGIVGNIQFDSNGKYVSDSIGVLTLSPTNGAAPIPFDIGVESLSQFESESTVFAASQDGYPIGVLTGYAIGPTGEVEGVFSNGKKKILGQISTSVFSNPAGLVKAGGNLFTSSINSGDPQVNKPGAGANSLLQTGALEMSNVDLGKEFTTMIITQRGFQANSRVISTTDQMLEELVNLKR